MLLGSSPQLAEWQGSQRVEELQWPTQELRALVPKRWQARLEPAESQQVPEQQVPEQQVPEQQVPEQQVPEQQVPPSARKDH